MFYNVSAEHNVTGDPVSSEQNNLT